MMFSLDQVVQWIIYYRYFIIFPVMVVEGPIITVIAGFLSSLGYFNIFVMYLVSILADLVGDTLYYSIGYWGRKRFIERWGHYIGITAGRVISLEKHFKRHSGKTIILGKLSQGLSGVALVAAGMVRMPYWRFLWFCLVATVPKSFILLLIGFYFGKAYARINAYLDYTAVLTIGLAVLLTIIYFSAKRISRKYGEESKD